MIIASVFLIVLGIPYIVYAFREPPKAIDHLFRIPFLFIFLPAHIRVKVGRIAVGAVLAGTGVFWILREIYRVIAGWI